MSIIGSRRILTAGALVAVTVSALALVGCTSSAPKTDGEIENVTGDELVSRAQDEGELVWYTSTTEPDALALAAAFEDEYGIPVLVQRSGGADTLQRFLLEADSGNVQNDVLGIGATAPFNEMLDAGYITPYIPADAEDRVEPQAIAEDGSWLGFFFQPAVIAYRTDLVDHAPKGWGDLLDPEFSDVIGHIDPNFSGVIGVVNGLQENMGWDWYESLAAQNVLMARTNNNLTDSMNSGEVEVGTFLYVNYAEGLKADGQPIDYVFPEEGTYALVQANAVMTDAPHPYAARLFQQFLISDTAQEIGTKSYNYSVLLDAAPPKGLPSLSEIGLWDGPASIPTLTQTRVLGQFNKIMGIG